MWQRSVASEIYQNILFIHFKIPMKNPPLKYLADISAANSWFLDWIKHEILFTYALKNLFELSSST